MRQSASPSSLSSLPVVLRRLAPGLFLAAAVLVTGCTSGPKDVVSGTVKTKDGKNVSGEITFKSSDGKEVKAGLLDGKYKVENVPKGELDVLIKAGPGGAIAGPAPTVPKDAKDTNVGTTASMGVPPNKKYEQAGQPGMKYKFEGGKKEGVDFTLDP